MQGMGLGMGPAKPEEEGSEGADMMAMKAFKKALSGSDSQAQLDAFRELMACCSEDSEDDTEE